MVRYHGALAVRHRDALVRIRLSVLSSAFLIRLKILDTSCSSDLIAASVGHRFEATRRLSRLCLLRHLRCERVHSLNTGCNWVNFRLLRPACAEIKHRASRTWIWLCSSQTFCMRQFRIVRAHTGRNRAETETSNPVVWKLWLGPRVMMPYQTPVMERVLSLLWMQYQTRHGPVLGAAIYQPPRPRGV